MQIIWEAKGGEPEPSEATAATIPSGDRPHKDLPTFLNSESPSLSHLCFRPLFRFKSLQTALITPAKVRDRWLQYKVGG